MFWRNKKASSKDVYGPTYNPGGGSGIGHLPTALDLIDAYRGVAYTCAKLNSEPVASTQVRLYAKTGPKQKSVRFWPTAPVHKRRIENLSSRAYLKKNFNQGDLVEEILEHPILELLNSPNPYLSGFELMELCSLYLDTVGHCYWSIIKDSLGVPKQLWVLPAHQVTPELRYREPDLDKGLVESYYFSGKHWSKKYSPEEIIHFRHPSLRDPYVEAWSPLMAAFDQHSIQDEWLGHEKTLFKNNSRPDAIVTPKDSSAPIGRTEADRLERWINAKFARGGAGSIMVMEEAMDVKPFSWSPRDLGTLEIRQKTKEELANAFGVPVALLKTDDVNRANADAAHYQHQRLAVRPRCFRIDDTLNRELCKLFDDRLFLAHDDPVEKDVAAAVARHAAYFTMGSLSPDEIRGEIGYEPIEGGDKTYVANTLVPLGTPPPTPTIVGPKVKKDQFATDSEIWSY